MRGRLDGALRGLRFDDEPREPLAGQEVPRPPEQRPDSAACQNQELNVDEGLANSPAVRTPNASMTAKLRPTVARFPLLKYLNAGRSGFPFSRLAIWRPT